jgi:hypothetical protein
MSMSAAGTTFTVTEVSVGRPRISVATKSGFADTGGGAAPCPPGLRVAAGSWAAGVDEAGAIAR